MTKENDSIAATLSLEEGGTKQPLSIRQMALVASGGLAFFFLFVTLLFSSPIISNLSALSFAVLGVLLVLEGVYRMDASLSDWKEIFLAIGQELRSIASLARHYFTDLTKENPTSETVGAGQPIVLVHGFLNKSSVWKQMKAELEVRGAGPIFTINLRSTLGSITKCAEQLRDFLYEVAEMTGRKDIVLVGYSMGGLVSLQCATDPSMDLVSRVVTIGSPIQGTWMGWAVPFSKGCMEMRRHSPFVQALEERQENKKEMPVFHLVAMMDQLVLPNNAAMSKHASEDSIRTFPHLCHTSLLFDSRVFDALADLLRMDKR